MVAEVMVFPVPGGPYTKQRGLLRAFFTASIYWTFSSGKLRALTTLGISTSRIGVSTSLPKSLQI